MLYYGDPFPRLLHAVAFVLVLVPCKLSPLPADAEVWPDVMREGDYGLSVVRALPITASCCS